MVFNTPTSIWREKISWISYQDHKQIHMHLWCFDEDSNSWDTVHVSTLSWHDQENLLGYNLPNTDLLLTAGGLDGMTNVSW